MKKNTILVRPYSLVELGALYSVCDRTMRKWIKPFETDLGERIGRYYNVAQVKLILQKLGFPTEIEID
jgi:hypothetical protein